LFLAHTRDELDCPTLDKLVAMNADMAQFLETVRIDLNAKEIHDAEYDVPPAYPDAYATFPASVRSSPSLTTAAKRAWDVSPCSLT